MIPTICLTSNRYVHLVPPFAYCWRHFWPDFNPRDMFLGYYDTEPPLDDNSARFWRMSLGKQDQTAWSTGLIKSLGAFHGSSQHVLLVLEDYWLNSPPDHAAIMDAHHLMRTNPRIGKIDLSGDRLNFPHVDWLDHPDYVAAVTVSHEYREDGGFRNKLYLMSYQAAIWRIDFLRDHLVPSEDPWQSEENGTKRLLDTGMLILGHRRAPLRYTQAVKAGKPDVLRTERFEPAFLDHLKSKGLLKPWAI